MTFSLENVNYKLCEYETQASSLLSVLGCWKRTILDKFHRHQSWLIELYTVFWTFLDFTKMWTRWNFESIFLKIAHPAKGSFWRNKRKSEFSELSWHSPCLQAMAIFCHCSFPTFFLPFSSPFSRFFYSCYLLHFISFRAVAKSWVLTKYKAWQWDLDQL